MRTSPNNDLRPYISTLKFMGFTQDYDSRAGGSRTVQFSRVTGRRRVEVQLFEGGAHRASHMYYRDDACNYGRMTTYPTPFSSGAGMLSAIAHEMTRTDNEIARAESADNSTPPADAPPC